jgi:hypothetical protein
MLPIIQKECIAKDMERNMVTVMALIKNMALMGMEMNPKRRVSEIGLE